MGPHRKGGRQQHGVVGHTGAALQQAGHRPLGTTEQAMTGDRVMGKWGKDERSAGHHMSPR